MSVPVPFFWILDFGLRFGTLVWDFGLGLGFWTKDLQDNFSTKESTTTTMESTPSTSESVTLSSVSKGITSFFFSFHLRDHNV